MRKKTFLQKFQKSTDIICHAFSLYLNQKRQKYFTKSKITRQNSKNLIQQHDNLELKYTDGLHK